MDRCLLLLLLLAPSLPPTAFIQKPLITTNSSGLFREFVRLLRLPLLYYTMTVVEHGEIGGGLGRVWIFARLCLIEG